MNRCRLIPFLLLLAAPLASAAPAKPAPAAMPAAVLRWHNGESIGGEMVAASATDVTWKSPLFDDPLVLSWTALHRIDQQVAAATSPDAFDIALRDGSLIHADSVSLTDDGISIHSTRHGVALLKRSEVLNIRRLHSGSLVVAAPVGGVKWSAVGTPRPGREDPDDTKPANVTFVTTGPAGALLLPYWNRVARLEVAPPAETDLELRLHSTKRPAFQLVLEGGPKNQLTLETWDDDLVLTAGDQFKLIRKIDEAERELALRLCWDQKTHKCAVYTAAGELLVEWEVPEDPHKSKGGLALQNKGHDLSLDFLRMRPWDGKAPQKGQAAGPRVELLDGRVIGGTAKGGANDALAIQPADQAPEISVSLNEVEAIVFSVDPPRAGTAEVSLSYADGTTLAGRLSSIENGHIALQTSLAEAPLVSTLDGLQQLLVNVPTPAGARPEPPLELLDKIVVRQETLHGKVTGAGDPWPRWLAVGAVKPSLPSKTAPVEISRYFPPDTAFPSASALFYTSTGDVLPGTLRALDRTKVEFDSSVFETTSLPAANLQAIQFGTGAQSKIQSFTDPGWRIIKGDENTVRRGPNDTLEMDPGTVFGHPSAMLADEISFKVPSSNFSTIRLRLFCPGTEIDKTHSTNLMLFVMSNQVEAGLESGEGQLQTQSRTTVAGDQVTEVRLVIEQKKLQLHINGMLMQTFSVGPDRRPGAGLIIEPASLWGNSVEPISMSEFSTPAAPGRTWLPEVNVETKTQALTVPRFRKEDPPHHALLGVNGDVLRGEIEAATATHFGFRSGLETFHVPRERVKAAIWLKKPKEDAPPASDNTALLKRLDRPIEQSMNYGSANLSTLISVLQSQSDDLKFKTPAKEDSRRFPMQFGGQTIGDALDQICSLFGLRYRLEKGDTIVLEPMPTLAKDMVRKTYWLQTGAFPATPPAQEVLTGKGVSFPAGADAVWQPATLQLSMTNSEPNHEKLVKVLASDFGGTLGSPTHWLLLTSGARFGLAVDQFGENSISGHHALYGRCTVPLSEVFSIRTTPPEPTPAMRALEDWRLVYAPEPVLPETGGEASAMLGKEAKTFKLALLGGGNFDLAKEKGKIVVLDFWATWCGPCIKSLPGLIEAMSAFPSDRVKLIGVNQAEPPEQVKQFLETRNWKLTVALDAGQSVAQQYGVEGIPHTVIVGPDGKVAWTKTGYSPDGDTEAANIIKQLLAEKK